LAPWGQLQLKLSLASRHIPNSNSAKLSWVLCLQLQLKQEGRCLPRPQMVAPLTQQASQAAGSPVQFYVGLATSTWAQLQATKILQSTADGCRVGDVTCSLMTSCVKLKKQHHDVHFVCVRVSLLSSCTFAARAQCDVCFLLPLCDFARPK